MSTSDRAQIISALGVVRFLDLASARETILDIA
jgi:hypothetical protein